MGKKKIGIVTFHMANNHGALLQCFALQTFLEKNHYEVVIINNVDENIEKDYRIFTFSSLRTFLSNVFYIKKIIYRYNGFNLFRKKYLKMGPTYNEKDLQEAYTDIDFWIAGSDQIWNADITNGLQNIYTLYYDSIKGKKISYAASIGKSKITQDEKVEFQARLESFDSISVRENTAKMILQELFPEKEIKAVCDPVLLLEKRDWEEVLEVRHRCFEDKYILLYLFEENMQAIEYAKELQKVTGLPIVHFGHRNKFFDNELGSAYTKNPEEFVNLIANAEYVVTESFHGMVFSIIFQKHFWMVLAETNRQSRVVDLLGVVGLQERILLSDCTDFKEICLRTINYDNVHAVLQNYISDSKSWLLKALE